jgi:hypothetical protein
MHEIIANLHIHTKYSDGSKLHLQIADDAMRSGVDVLFFSDHNLHINGLDGYYVKDGCRVLSIIGEEIHDQNRIPQKNHLLAFGIDRSYAQWADDPQVLIDQINQSKGLTFIAHPYDPALPAFHEPDISWVDWSISGFTGLELWNAFSEMKVRVKSRLQALCFAFFPRLLALQPPVRIIDIWDHLLQKGDRVVAIAGSDAHALRFRLGWIKRTIFPYHHHIKTINTHLLLDTPLGGNEKQDRDLVMRALAEGHCFVGHDAIRSTRGFRFYAQSNNQEHQMGDEVMWKPGMKIIVEIPAPAECRLIHNGRLSEKKKVVKEESWEVSEPGYYRVECFRNDYFRKRGWIFSNPVYIR